jgi:hypothetical protein
VLGEFGAFRRSAVHSLLGLPGVLGEFGAFPPSAPSSVFPEYSAGSVPSVCPRRLPTPSSVFRSFQLVRYNIRNLSRGSRDARCTKRRPYIYIFIYMAALGCQSPVHHGSGFK